MLDTFNLRAEISIFEILKLVSPEATLWSRIRMGSIWQSFHYIVFEEGCLTPSIYTRKFGFLKSWKCSIYIWDVMGWMDVWNGRGYQMCPSMLFILYGYMEYVYICIYIYMYFRVVTNILMGFKIRCQVGSVGKPFSQLPDVREFSNIWFQTCLFLSLI